MPRISMRRSFRPSRLMPARLSFNSASVPSLCRLKPAVVWPQLTLDECEAQTRVLLVEWIRTLHEEDLSRRVDYTNSQGERWNNTIEDILTHVVLHGTYHRGQIATIVRQSGETPAYTDYIHAVRQGLVD